jgi:hypothetical protein
MSKQDNPNRPTGSHDDVQHGQNPGHDPKQAQQGNPKPSGGSFQQPGSGQKGASTPVNPGAQGKPGAEHPSGLGGKPEEKHQPVGVGSGHPGKGPSEKQ